MLTFLSISTQPYMSIQPDLRITVRWVAFDSQLMS